MPRNKMIFLAIGAIALVALTVGASAYVTTRVLEDKKAPEQVVTSKGQKQSIKWDDNRQQQAAAPQPATPKCDDGNIVGTIVGGVGGGVAGNQIGKGSGNTAATIGGTLGGAYLGNQFIPTRNVTCAK